MKVRLSIPGRAITVDMENERKAVRMFNQMAAVLLELQERQEGGQGKPREVEPVTEEPVISERKTYSGFLYLKCKECGEIRGFCPKKGIETYHCSECGAETPFSEELKPLYVNCECGEKYKYMTNMTEEIFDIQCIECGNPVAVKWNEKKQIYETVR